jgi:ribosomal-protein-alanine N-acetyltransferase
MPEYPEYPESLDRSQYPIPEDQPYLIRAMHTIDVPRVSYIEMRSFTMPWSPMAYLHEINHNPNAAMAVIQAPLPEEAPWYIEHELMAFAGLWQRRRRAHISTLASHPDYRGRGFGELILVAMIAKAIAIGVKQVTLDVRVSNVVAQNLYRKYEFDYANLQVGYYSDDGEDAYLMIIPGLNRRYQQRFQKRVAALMTKVHFQDEFSGLKLEQMCVDQ